MCVAETLHLGLEGGEAAVEPGFYGREWGRGHAGDLFEGELFVEAEDEDFAVVGLELEEDFGDLGGVFAGAELFEGGGAVDGDLEGAGVAVFGAFAHLVEGGHGALAGEVDDEVAGDGEEPGVEAGLAVVLSAAQEDTHPGLLEEVFGDLALAGEEEEIAQEAVLVELDELVEDLGVLALEAARDGDVFLLAAFGDRGGERGGARNGAARHSGMDDGSTGKDAFGAELMQRTRVRMGNGPEVLGVSP